MAFTASQVERIAECTAAGALPQVHTSSDAADDGNVKHAFHCDVFTYGRDKALANTPKKHRDFCAGIDLDQLFQFLNGPDEIIPELSIVYDFETDKARVLGSNIGRAYGVLKDTEIACTIDIAAFSSLPTQIKVIDLKTGRTPVPAAAENWQLKTCAVLAAKAYGATVVDVAIAYLQEDGSYRFDCASFDAFELAIFASQLREMAKAIAAAKAKYLAGEILDVKRGDWCRWCNSYVHCPAQTALMKTLNTQLVADIDPGELTPTRAAEEWVKLQWLKRALTNIEATLTDYAKIQPFTLPNGNIVKEETTIKKYMNGTIALNVLRENYGDEVTAKAVEAKASATSVRRALGSKANEALRLIEEAGGFKPTKSTKVCEVAPPKLRAKP